MSRNLFRDAVCDVFATGCRALIECMKNFTCSVVEILITKTIRRGASEVSLKQSFNRFSGINLFCRYDTKRLFKMRASQRPRKLLVGSLQSTRRKRSSLNVCRKLQRSLHHHSPVPHQPSLAPHCKNRPEPDALYASVAIVTSNNGTRARKSRVKSAGRLVSHSHLLMQTVARTSWKSRSSGSISRSSSWTPDSDSRRRHSHRGKKILEVAHPANHWFEKTFDYGT